MGANGDLEGYNLFAYCSNNPISFIDSTGKFLLSAFIIGAVVGAVVNAATSAISQQVTTGEINWAEVGISALGGAITGAAATTGIGLVANVALNVAVDSVEYMTVQAVNNEPIRGDELAMTVAFSIITAGEGLNASKQKTTYQNATKMLKSKLSDKNAQKS